MVSPSIPGRGLDNKHLTSSSREVGVTINHRVLGGESQFYLRGIGIGEMYPSCGEEDGNGSKKNLRWRGTADVLGET